MSKKLKKNSEFSEGNEKSIVRKVSKKCYENKKSVKRIKITLENKSKEIVKDERIL